MGGIEGVGAGQLEHRQCRGRLAVEIAVHVIILGAQLHAFFGLQAVLVAARIPDDVLEMNDGACVAGFENDVLKLVHGGKPPLGIDGQLKLNRRGGGYGVLAEPTGGHLAILLLDGINHIDRCQVLGGELIRIEPDAHAVVARPEKSHVADSFDARQVVLDAQGREVAEIKLVVVIAATRLLFRHQVHAQEDARRFLLRRDTDAFHFLGQLGLGDGDTVLHQHLGGIQIGSQLKCDVQVHLAVIGALGRHVQHALDAVDFLLDRRGHGVGHRLGIGAGVSGRHLHGRRRDFRVLSYRKLGIGHHADN